MSLTARKSPPKRASSSGKALARSLPARLRSCAITAKLRRSSICVPACSCASEHSGTPKAARLEGAALSIEARIGPKSVAWVGEICIGGRLAENRKRQLAISRKNSVRPDGAVYQWRKVSPSELSVALVADERF